MNFPSIRIEGQIFSGELLQRLDQPDMPGQRPADFGLPSDVKVKDEIARAWADAQDYWRIFQRKLESQKLASTATTETRQQWIVPLLGLLGYQLEYQSRGAELNGKIYAISHRAVNRAQIPVHIVGYRDPAGLDRKPENATLRMSPHAMVQEYINLHDQLYGIVTNGATLRLLRDSFRLVRLNYLEFDLDRMFTDGLFADFAVLYRLLHATRLPATAEDASVCLIEKYHQDAIDQGTRIREGLSEAVEHVIVSFANGFLSHPDNEELCRQVASGQLSSTEYYQCLLRLIYRFLFLLVIEERKLVFASGVPLRRREIYERDYSLQRMRRLAENPRHVDRRQKDLWLSILATFRLFEADGPGEKLGVSPLAGELFGPDAIGPLNTCSLDNVTALEGFRSLILFRHPGSNQIIRANYASLNFEEFGSVYEGLLEYAPVFNTVADKVTFAFVKGEERAATGSHYTPDELVQPLIRHSLDYLIADKLKEKDKEKALLSLRIADISCGSGHILLAAARRVATELAVVRTGEEQPSPTAFRAAIRDVIRECIYGVDLNPLAVELCKVALWLEAHNPGQPLNFLDHHIKCGNSIVGYVRREELDKGVPDEAFKALPGDDKDVVAQWRKRNKAERNERGQQHLDFSPAVREQLSTLLNQWHTLSALPEHTPAEIEVKKAKFSAYAASRDTLILKQIAAIPVAQFYIPKTTENDISLISDAQFRRYWHDAETPQGQATAMAWSTAHQKRFFHWFLEFPEIIDGGGFDCILGNPPYKGGQHLSGLYGHGFCEYVKCGYAPAGLSDLVVYFVRRIFTLLKPAGFTAFITTNSIKDGDIRKDGLEQVIAQGGSINMAVRGIKWPGVAKLFVSLVSLHKGAWRGRRSLDNQDVKEINAYFEDSEVAGAPALLVENQARVFQGSIFLGDGFLLSHEEADRMRASDPRNADVLFPLINGQELNNQPDQAPGRSIINFHDWSELTASKYSAPFDIVKRLVQPVRADNNRALYRDRWWQYAERRPGLVRATHSLCRCFAAARTTKHFNFSACPTHYVYSDALYVFTTDRWDLYAVVQSTLHEIWARKYSGSLETRLRYSPSDCFETFAFPSNLWRIDNPTLAALGERYHEHRKSHMLSLWLGLTDIYNLFHARDLSPALVSKVSKKPIAEAELGYRGILELRNLHVDLDIAVRDAYGWQDLALDHDFYEIETLPENDRLRYTINPAARKELLKRLLALNHTRAAEEAAKAVAEKSAKKVRLKKSGAKDTVEVPDAGTIVMPKELRYTLTPDVYAYRMIQQLLQASGGEAPIRQIARAYAVLSDKTLAGEIAAAKGMDTAAKDWLGAASQRVDLAEFMPAVKKLIDREFLQWHGNGLEGTLKLTSDARAAEDDVWIVADSDLALHLTRDLPSSITTKKAFMEIESLVSKAA
jgi:hypothetical protein